MLTDKDYNNLLKIESNGYPLVSIYTPTFRTGNTQEDRLRFKNALNEAMHCIIDGNLFPELEIQKSDARKYLHKGFELLEDEEFWLHLSDGLAVFIGPDYFQKYTLPIPFNHRVMVGKKFYTRHLQPIISGDRRFFLLALSQGGVRFFEMRKHAIYSVEIADLVPQNMEEAIDKQKETVIQSHSSGKENPIYHGHGGGRESRIHHIQEYFKQVDKGLMTMLHDEYEPMILAGVDYLIPIYKEASSYPNIAESYISGNHENTDTVLLHELAWRIMQPMESEKRKNDSAKFSYNKSKELASDKLEEIILAAKQGKVEKLYVDRDATPIWGHTIIQKEKYAVHISDKQKIQNSDLIEETVVSVWKNGGQVLEVPREEMLDGSSPLNALYRY